LLKLAERHGSRVHQHSVIVRFMRRFGTSFSVVTAGCLLYLCADDCCLAEAHDEWHAHRLTMVVQVDLTRHLTVLQRSFCVDCA
jgi:hypothetical protein